MSTTTSTKKTVTESLELLNGFDEIAIEKAFGTDIDNLRATMTLRALIFIDKRREGLNVKAAYDAVMELTAKQLSEHFADDEVEVMPDEPVGEPGKDVTTAG